MFSVTSLNYKVLITIASLCMNMFLTCGFTKHASPSKPSFTDAYFSGSDENNETLSLQRRMQLRKTRLELLGKEYEV